MRLKLMTRYPTVHRLWNMPFHPLVLINAPRWVTAPSVIYVTIPTVGLGPNPWPPQPLPHAQQAPTRFSWRLLIRWSWDGSLGVQFWEVRDLGAVVIYRICPVESRRDTKTRFLCSKAHQVRSLPFQYPLLNWVSLSLSRPFFPWSSSLLRQQNSANELQQNNGGSGLQGFPVNRWIKVNKVQSHCRMCGVQ